MDRLETIDVLNQLLRILYRSLPRYVTSSHLWARRNGQEALEVLARIAADQEAQAVRVVQAIQQLDGVPDVGQFPMAFAALNDLDVSYVIRRATEYHRRDVELIRRRADLLAAQPELQRLAEDIRRSAETHLEMLQALTPETATAAAS
ncbi:MAG TPA: hypothetical protein EYP56_04770 [Planctomycetaceae bacterium]|nr:hypothetical protein [Planctomycetaceae bacterium]HIQ22615.1 hypothetical protein [Planctomycetota bacterium]